MLLLVLLIAGLSSCGVKARIKRADKKFAIGEYYEAADIYKSVNSRISSKSERALKARVAFNMGECYRALNNPRAAQSYQNAIRYKYQDSIVYLRSAQVLQQQAKYKDAEKGYLIYLEAHPDCYAAKAGAYACRQVSDWKKESTRYRVAPAKDFNAKRSANFAPAFIGQEGDAVMFTSNRSTSSGKGNKKKLKRPSPVTGAQNFTLFQTRKNAAGQWEEIEPAEGLASEEKDEEESQKNDSTGAQKAGSAEIGVCCFTADGKTMYFTYSCPINGQDQGAKIYVSNRASGEWGEPQEVKIFNDSSITVGHPSINMTADTLYFVSDAPGGFGGKDIWFAEWDGNEWINPQNMGPRVNTTEDEMFPCIHPDGSLYFSSNGHPGYGGLDLFKAERDTTRQPEEGEPIAYTLLNMGPAFNSNGDDFGITFIGNTQNGLFSTTRGGKKGLEEIYSFTLPEMEFIVEGTVVDNKGENISDATIRLVGDDGTNSKLNVRRDGTYKIRIKKEVRYVMLCTARGYLNARDGFDTRGLKDSKTYTMDFSLAPISKPVTMDNIFYEFGKWDLTPASENGLKSLVKLLQDNPNITIELSAHTDMVGDSLRNIELSRKRAESVVSYLIRAGIEKERLTPVGYGKNKPVVADKALCDKYKFIPAEQVLDETFILGLPKDQQEICNQINRRTEFKVLKTTYKLY